MKEQGSQRAIKSTLFLSIIFLGLSFLFIIQPCANATQEDYRHEILSEIDQAINQSSSLENLQKKIILPLAENFEITVFQSTSDTITKRGIQLIDAIDVTEKNVILVPLISVGFQNTGFHLISEEGLPYNLASASVEWGTLNEIHYTVLEGLPKAIYYLHITMDEVPPPNSSVTYYFLKITPLKSKFTISDLTISPESVKKGETVSLSIKVENIGNEPGEYEVLVKINEVLEDVETIFLKPMETETVSYEMPTGKVGNFNIDVNGLEGHYIVKKPSNILVQLLQLAVLGAILTYGISLSRARARNPQEENVK